MCIRDRVTIAAPLDHAAWTAQHNVQPLVGSLNPADSQELRKIPQVHFLGGKDTIVGYECDGCELEWKDGLPFPTFRDGTPKTFEVLASAPAKWHPDDCEWYERWENGRSGNAVLGAYVRGGTVVTVGSTDWSHGLRGGDPLVDRITRNVLERLGR